MPYCVRCGNAYSIKWHGEQCSPCYESSKDSLARRVSLARIADAAWKVMDNASTGWEGRNPIDLRVRVNRDLWEDLKQKLEGYDGPS